MRAFVYEWQDRDEDVTASIESWERFGHPSIVAVLWLATTESASVGETECGIYIDASQALELAECLNDLAAAHRPVPKKGEK